MIEARDEAAAKRSGAFAREFFDLQLSFAERVQALSGMPLERALFEYTNLYVRFGLGRSFDPDHESWQAYLAGLHDAEDRREWTYRFYLRDPEAKTAPPLVATFGCFSYAFSERSNPKQVRLHFRNTEPEGCSPLAAARVDQRRADLRALFAHLKRTASEDVSVVGVSWLYNLEAYCRLFPAEYGSSARPVRGKYRSMPIWGQFLDYRGEIKEALARPFLASLEKSSTLAEVEESFPFEVLTVHAAARRFCDFYGV